jgi:hypothetical protein
MALGWCCKALFVSVAIIAVAHAAEIEHDIADERGNIDYRISFKTYDPMDHMRSHKPTAEEEKARDEMTSTGKFTIVVIVMDGTTGPMDLIDHPSQTKDLGESKAWKIQPGMVQVAKINAANVGEIEEIKIEGDSKDKWSPAWIKVNSNDYHSGKGNGIYFASGPDSGIQLGEGFSVRSDTDPEDRKNHLYKCMASFCNHHSEKRYATEGDAEPPTHEHGDMFGPLGEGMPGTEHDHTMTRGHFMREFMAMEHVDEDDEDFLRTHSV